MDQWFKDLLNQLENLKDLVTHDVYLVQWDLRRCSELTLARFKSKKFKENLIPYLAGSELEYLSKINSVKRLREFVVGRLIVRNLAGRALDLGPSEINIHKDHWEKPYIQPEQNHRQLEFNISHSKDWIVVALGFERKIGVDIEDTTRPVLLSDLVTKYFGEVEQKKFWGLPESVRLKAFFSAWTQKESMLKAIGTGLALSASHIEVEIDPSKPCGLKGIHQPPMVIDPSFMPTLSVQSWWLTRVEIDDDAHHTGTLSVSAQPSQLHHCHRTDRL